MQPSRSILDNVLEAIRGADFAVLLLTPDDVLISRSRRRAAARDDVVFELGMAFGALGPGRAFFLVPRDSGPEIFAGLAGGQSISYPPPGQKGWVSAMGSPAAAITEAIGRSRPAAVPSAGLVDPALWTQRWDAGPLEGMFLETFPEAQLDLGQRLDQAREQISLFGLTRNFFARDAVRELLVHKARTIPVRMYLMDPTCAARAERYRVEPVEAAFEDPDRAEREILGPLRTLERRAAEQSGRREGAGLKVYLYNFPCSFAIEQIDNSCRVMLYGHGQRGTEGPNTPRRLPSRMT